jgi:hypothetical protein
MISHKHKCIFIHIPKCAGTSITNLFFKENDLDWRKPNYKIHYGWCPERKIHMQHATPKQMIDLDLLDVSTWNKYYKFTIVRNPWSRSLSDYMWLKKTKKIEDTFENYLTRNGKFYSVLRDQSNINYRGDHLNTQSSYLETDNFDSINQIIRFENMKFRIPILLNQLGFRNLNIPHSNRSKNKYNHYSEFYNRKKMKLVKETFIDDITKLGYKFEDKRNLFHVFKNWYAKP